VIRERTLWSWQLVTGAVIFLLLGLHMLIMHLAGVVELRAFNPAADGDPLAWENVAHRARQGFFTVTYVLLLAAALFHGLNGLRNVLFELHPPPGLRRLIVAVLVVVGGALLALGSWAAVAARTTATLAGG